ncbi:MAG: hydroxyethylthiazole kinase [Pseudomonadota bacterium]
MTVTPPRPNKSPLHAPSAATSPDTPGPDAVALNQALNQMRATAPLVQNITNYVAMNMMANVMLAAGASPAMVHAKAEAPEFVKIAQALTINIGTLSPRWVESMMATAEAAVSHQKPWVLDPVAVGATDYRRQVAADLLHAKPSIIRGNGSEIMALAGVQATGRGVDSADTVELATEAAETLARDHGAVVAVSGPRDYVTDGARRAWISNGHPLMPRVTALGCSLNGIIAAFTATGSDAFTSTVAAMAFYGVAGDIAGEQARGPGSFVVAFLDALMAVDGDSLALGARVTLPS